MNGWSSKLGGFVTKREAIWLHALGLAWLLLEVGRSAPVRNSRWWSWSSADHRPPISYTPALLFAKLRLLDFPRFFRRPNRGGRDRSTLGGGSARDRIVSLFNAPVSSSARPVAHLRLLCEA